MKFNDIVKWNSRVSALYALGIWSMFGSYAYFRYTGRYDSAEKKEVVPKPETQDQVVYQTPHTKSVIIYKKDFVPYSTRIYNFIRSFSSEPGSGDAGK